MILGSNWLTVTVIVLVCVGILFGNIEMIRAVFRRQEIVMQRQREAIDFGLENFDLLKDKARDLLTSDSLRLAKYRVAEDKREFVQILIDKLSVWGKVIETRGTGANVSYVFGATRDDLTRARGSTGK
jgi:hypothetical protein